MWRPYLYLERSVPTIFRYGNVDNLFWEDKGESPAKLHLDWCQSRFGRTRGSAGPLAPLLATVFGRETDMWVLFPGMYGPRSCTSVCCDEWALLVSVMQDEVFCVFMLRLVLVFSLFRVWVPANQESPKLVELIRIKPYNYFLWFEC